MNFKQIDIQKCYETGTHDLVADFYSPVLSAAVSYDRIAGFFSSSALAIVAEGLADFIRNKGKMRLITSPRLQQEDIDEISTSKSIYLKGGSMMLTEKDIADFCASKTTAYPASCIVL